MVNLIKSKNDNIYSRRQKHINDFAFDEKVVAVFPDMINRSVPGYQMIVRLMGMLAAKSLQKGGLCYDLGCSLGAVSLSILDYLDQKYCRIKAVDNSPAMIEKLQQLLNDHPKGNLVEPTLNNIEDVTFESADVMLMNFTLQFIVPEKRQKLLRDIYNALRPGGIFLLAEKINFSDEAEQEFQTRAHYEFKRFNGYSELEISQKRSALEKVMIPDCLEVHLQRCREAGFDQVYCWFQCFNFVALIAEKS